MTRTRKTVETEGMCWHCKHPTPNGEHTTSECLAASLGDEIPTPVEADAIRKGMVATAAQALIDRTVKDILASNDGTVSVWDDPAIVEIVASKFARKGWQVEVDAGGSEHRLSVSRKVER